MGEDLGYHFLSKYAIIQSKRRGPPMEILLDVPQILQNPELPNGCEITSLC